VRKGAVLIGAKLGPYEVVAKLGEGGMGEVWRARDSQLGRDVALKVLPEGFTSDPERLQRFEREARLLAQLNHPNIAQIYGMEASGETRALVMELVEGPTLAERQEHASLSFSESLSFALQIAQALEEAHEKGIVHRDLKPQNIKASREGRIKVLDFGLAKAMDPVGSASGGSGSASQLAQSPTLTIGATMQGVILGTAAYMAPEQAKGMLVDKRADIWAFGVVLYEMLAGARLFAGDSVTDTLADVLRREVDFGALPPATPPAIRRLLRRCLERNPKNRLHDIADARIVLEEVARGESEPAGPAPEPAREARASRLPWLVAAASAVLAVAAIVVATRGGGAPSGPPRPRTLMGISVPHEHFLIRAELPLLDLAPDGRSLFFAVESGEGARVYRRTLDRLEARAVEGTEGGEAPVVSTDGRWLAFFANGLLRKVPVEGGGATTVAEARAPRGACWLPDGSLVFSPMFNSGLFRVAASGGRPTPVTQLDATRGERTHRFPQALPGGEAVLFTVGSIDSPGDYDDATIEAVRIATGERKVVLRGARMARYAAGYLVFQRESTLLAVAFDPARLETRGEPFVALESVAGEVSSGAGFFAVASDGTIAAAPESAIQRERTLVRVDREGRESELPVAPAEFNQPRFSPDGRRLAVAIGSGSAADDDLYLVDLDDGRLQRITFGQGHGAPAWSLDGRSVLFSNGRRGETGLYLRNADGSGAEKLLLSAGGTTLADGWHPDGRRLAITDTERTLDVLLLEADGTGRTEPLFASNAAAEYGPSFSPDGQWIAYVTTETGADEVFVESFPPGRGKWQISSGGGLGVVWSRDGRSIFYLSGDTIYEVEVETAGSFRAGVPRPLFRGPYELRTPPRRNFDVGPDGSFVFVKRKYLASAPRELVLLEGWQAADPARGAR
jgi:Tol biopolymer transport system component